ncbi:pentapeptide repeat-containing protein [Chryseobacterium gwangjuense]|uniref:pentapeptide repeat-containing protein n=1 Tax=Chryseobacterium gwangjuense TaxID=1069980 RepID=UPI001E3FC655|nr:pentapeptide repeat-containing protein [Chryseobacterium gwangjuense]MCE3076114.1 pentapeptide repeat-containing protein [Chryseobacterium gwangjuense]
MLNTKIIGNKIAKARKEANMSQAQISELLFVSPQAVGKWERGESVPDIITCNRLAEVLGVDLNYFSENFQSPSNEQPSSKPVEIQNIETVPHKPKWNMSSGNWIDADFSGLKNLNEKFSSSNMQRCKFIGSDLSSLILKNNNVDHCDFSGSDISNSNFQRSHLANNQFKNCSLREAKFSGSYIYNCDLTGSDCTGMTIHSGGFEKNTMINTIWNRTSFVETHLNDIIFEGTVEDCSFENCSFKKVTFQNAKLVNTFFKCKNLKNIHFVDCHADRITYEFLKSGKADLNGITLLNT